jgi:hypothetical protein
MDRDYFTLLNMFNALKTLNADISIKYCAGGGFYYICVSSNNEQYQKELLISDSDLSSCNDPDAFLYYKIFDALGDIGYEYFKTISNLNFTSKEDK